MKVQEIKAKSKDQQIKEIEKTMNGLISFQNNLLSAQQKLKKIERGLTPGKVKNIVWSKKWQGDLKRTVDEIEDSVNNLNDLSIEIAELSI